MAPSVPHGSPAAGLARLAVPTALALGACAALVTSFEEPRELSASNVTRIDFDGDGLTDLQEEILGSDPDQPDSDFDGYSDLEELARGSDLVDDASVPGARAYSVGTFASSEADVLTLGSAAYVKEAQISSLGLGLGFVVDGEPVLIRPSDYQRSSRTFLYPAAAPGEWIAIIELAIPGKALRQLGELSFFAAAYESTPESPQIDPDEVVLNIKTLTDFDGIPAAVEPAPSNLVAPQGDPDGTSELGVVYRPLTGEAEIPADWESGKVCWQNTAEAGSNGASIVLEVIQSDCLELDSFCSPSDCGAKVGRTLEVPDPGALIGG